MLITILQTMIMKLAARLPRLRRAPASARRRAVAGRGQCAALRGRGGRRVSTWLQRDFNVAEQWHGAPKRWYIYIHDVINDVINGDVINGDVIIYIIYNLSSCWDFWFMCLYIHIYIYSCSSSSPIFPGNSRCLETWPWDPVRWWAGGSPTSSNG